MDGKRNIKTVDYVFTYSPYHLFYLPFIGYGGDGKRGYNVSAEWK